jgi:isopentenyl-diphosphate Delta-isomerase
MSDNQHQLDQVILVDENDQEIGVMDKVEAHRGEGLLHRAISVYLFRKKGQDIELLVQQRSSKKIVGAGQWANTVCGNVRPGETRIECAHRRLKEELGIHQAHIIPLYTFTYQVRCNDQFSEHEIDQVFVGVFDGEINVNPDEAQQIDWIEWQALAGHTIGNEYGGKKLAPWFIWMLHDEALVKQLQHFVGEI